ncbi:hypothetical protein Tco_0284910 [Tanacetum coccineum]
MESQSLVAGVKNRPAFYNNDDDDKEYTIAITPILSTEEPDNSLSMGDKHIDTVPAMESDEVIKSSVEILVPIPSESEGTDIKEMDIIKAKPGKAEHEKERISSGSPTSYSDLSLTDYEAFFRDSEPDSRDFTMDVVEVIFDNPTREPRVHVPNVLPTHPTLHLDQDFILSSDSLFAYVVWIFLPFLTYPVAPQYLLSSGNEDTIFDLGISIYHSFMPGVITSSENFHEFMFLSKPHE